MKTKMREALVFEMGGLEISTVNLSCFINMLGTFAKIFCLFIS